MKFLLKKTYVTILTLLCTACSTKYFDYVMYNQLSTSQLKNKTIKVIGSDEIEEEEITKYFTEYGLKLIKNKNKKTDYVAIAQYNIIPHYGYRNIPMYGKTGISSINTNTYGTLSRGLNYGSYDYSGYSTSTVNYDYGITGWQTIPYVEYETIFTYSIKKYTTLKKMEKESPLYTASLSINDRIHKWDMYLYLSTAIRQYGIEKDRVLQTLDCYYSEYKDKITCEEPRGIISNIIDMFRFKD